jgi:recombination protein RecT
MANEIVKDTGTVATLATMMRERKAAIEQALPKHLTAERLMRVAVNCVSKSPQLQQCSPLSLYRSVLVAAELGLEPGGALGHLYLVPYKTECTAQIGYRGLVHLARQSGEVSTVRTVVVRERDTFGWTEGFSTRIEHEVYLAGDPGPLKHVYCVVGLKDGTFQAELMSRAQVDAVKAKSKTAGRDDSPWALHYDEMARKTVAKRGLKWAPLSSERYVRALEVDAEDYVEGEVSTPDVVSASLKERVAKKAGRLFPTTEELDAATPESAPNPKPTPPKE